MDVNHKNIMHSLINIVLMRKTSKQINLFDRAVFTKMVD
ncbi:hypothetical protein BvCmsSIP079_01147 [Escherichia coli]|nr:hypothetical protein BvCmsHHP005_01916 [Escherichia coli]GDI37989.1 hypothetical protein BvCmsKKP051_04729 [Escherichia coli]GDU71754.1 hypothetical protein BvCmsSIP083_01321 [Escherichia coli]GDV78377.1 hypothetical protein BvCmsSIP079_01147 [Escherichia coli]